MKSDEKREAVRAKIMREIDEVTAMMEHNIIVLTQLNHMLDMLAAAPWTDEVERAATDYLREDDDKTLN